MSISNTTCNGSDYVMILPLKACYLGTLQGFLSFANKTLSNSLRLRNLYGAAKEHLEEIIIYDLEGEVLYHRHLSLLLQFFHLLELQLNRLH